MAGSASVSADETTGVSGARGSVRERFFGDDAAAASDGRLSAVPAESPMPGGGSDLTQSFRTSFDSMPRRG